MYRDTKTIIIEELMELENRRKILEARLKSFSRPHFLIRWYRILFGRCPICKIKMPRNEINLLDIEVFCPVDRGHYYTLFHRNFGA